VSDYGRLAFTGLSTVSIFGVVIDQWWIALAGILLLVAGIVALRLGFRRDRSVGQR
jgi:type IV secretory pathway TrbD component